MAIRKPTRPPHFGRTRPRFTFATAYRRIAANPARIFRTTGNRRRFKATAQRAIRGRRQGQQVIVFRTPAGLERARAYSCCWSCRTNCNRTYVDCYVLAL